jgi:hypothetical protein
LDAPRAGKSDGQLETASAAGRPACGGGRFWFAEWDDEDVPALFAEHYTTGTRRELPFMHLDGPEPILKLLTAGGFMEVAAEPRPDLGLGNGVPYLITATTR